MSWDKLIVGDKFINGGGDVCTKTGAGTYTGGDGVSEYYFIEDCPRWGFKRYYKEPKEKQMTQFKVGDKVVCVRDTCNFLLLGAIGVVVRSYAWGAEVRFASKTRAMLNSELELLKPKHKKQRNAQQAQTVLLLCSTDQEQEEILCIYNDRDEALAAREALELVIKDRHIAVLDIEVK